MVRETPLELKARARAIFKRLGKTHPDWGPTLEFSTPFELLVATILAAQARDERVNIVTRRLFQKYRGPADYLAVPVAELEKDVHETGFFRQKAKTLRACSEQILTKFGGEVPATMESLTSLRGVGRKTASIVLGNAFSVPAIAVDRHVARLAGRLRLAPPKEMKEEKIEESLRAVFPKKDWVKATWLLVLHGRRICRPTPRCYECPVNEICPYPKKTKAPGVPAIHRSTPRRSPQRR